MRLPNVETLKRKQNYLLLYRRFPNERVLIRRDVIEK